MTPATASCPFIASHPEANKAKAAIKKPNHRPSRSSCDALCRASFSRPIRRSCSCSAILRIRSALPGSTSLNSRNIVGGGSGPENVADSTTAPRTLTGRSLSSSRGGRSPPLSGSSDSIWAASALGRLSSLPKASKPAYMSAPIRSRSRDWASRGYESGLTLPILAGPMITVAKPLTTALHKPRLALR